MGETYLELYEDGTGKKVPDGVASGDGLVSEEELQKGYVWLNKVVKDVFSLTPEDLAEHFGVEGKFDKEEYSDHMQRNKRYYSWISEDDPTHFIYVNFDEKDATKEPPLFLLFCLNIPASRTPSGLGIRRGLLEMFPTFMIQCKKLFRVRRIISGLQEKRE